MEGSLKDLSKYRFESSVEALEDAKLLFENGRYKSSLNKGYYSIFYGIKAVNALDGYDSSKHSGVIAHFNHEYVKTGVFTKEASKIIKKAFESRERADYLDFYIASKEEAEEQINRAEIFHEWVKIFLIEKEVIDV